MARIRTIKPSFFRSEDVAELSLRARLTWVGLWTQCDDEGRMKDNARLIKGDIWPLDNVSIEDIEQDLAELATVGRIVRYEVEGRRFLAITNWSEHQRIQKPSPSKIPAPNGTGGFPDGSGSPTGNLPERSPVDNSTLDIHAGQKVTESSGSPIGLLSVGREGNKEGKGGEGTRASAQNPPPPRCPRHVDNPAPGPCGPCKDARLARETWETDRARAIRDCRLCTSDGWRLVPGRGLMIEPPERCDHRPLRSVS